MIKSMLFIISVVAFFLLLSPPASGQVQNPRLILTWRTGTYAPSAFTGKTLPIALSTVSASVALIDENGRSVDLSAQTVYWHLNDKFLQGGPGLERISFTAPDTPGETALLTAELPEYGDSTLLKTVEIPIVEPEVVIETPLPGARITGDRARLAALPYFFNVKSSSELSYVWSVNGESPAGAENPEVLEVTVNSDALQGSVIQVNVSVRNPRRIFEVASRIIELLK